jgi:hypothetical protein
MTAVFSPSRPAAAALNVETWSRIKTLNPSLVSDVLHAHGIHNHVMRADIQALAPGVRLFGVARTITTRWLRSRQHKQL